jgi:hypothetical protein
MPKKRKKTKADEKEDAFERLYAFLAASTPGLPSLEKTLLPQVEKIKELTHEEKEKEKAEFDKLYRQLSSLSGRKQPPTDEPKIEHVEDEPKIEHVEDEPKIEHVEDEPKIEHVEDEPKIEQVKDEPKIEHVKDEPKIEHVNDEPKIEHVNDEPKIEHVPSTDQFEEIYAQIVHIIAMKSQMQSVRIKQEPIKQKVKEILQCKACCKTFSTKGCFTRHQQTSSICQSWLSLPAEEQHPVVETPIHVKVNEYLEQAITGEPLQCKFCLATFLNRGNHHKHYQTSLPCNRMAYVEFKRIVAL